jgi:four helix bundle suffix protein
MQGYKKLFTYWYTLIIYDLTVEFCERWIKSWKLKEQMTGAARSGKQNIVEGSEGMKTSLKNTIKLTNVAKASLEELLADYEDFLRQRNRPQWGKDDPRVVLLRRRTAALVRTCSLRSQNLAFEQSSKVRNLSNLSNLRWQEQLPLPKDLEEAANLLLTLCHQATYLLNKQVESLERKHQTEGGYTEKLYWRRQEYRRTHRK